MATNKSKGAKNSFATKNKKLISLKELSRLSAYLKKNNKKIITTNGVFDILHSGHVRYLQKAAKLGDVLIVAINSDSSVRKLKGKTRPIVSEYNRAEVLCALECVDYVCIFTDATPLKFLSLIKPNIHVKGGDYDPLKIPETALLKKNGGKMLILPFEKGFSTTSIIEKIQNSCCEEECCEDTCCGKECSDKGSFENDCCDDKCCKHGCCKNDCCKDCK